MVEILTIDSGTMIMIRLVGRPDPLVMVAVVVVAIPPGVVYKVVVDDGSMTYSLMEMVSAAVPKPERVTVLEYGKAPELVSVAITVVTTSVSVTDTYMVGRLVPVADLVEKTVVCTTPVLRGSA